MSLLVVAFGVALLTVPAIVSSGDVSPATRTRTAYFAIIAGLTIIVVGLGLTASPLSIWLHDRGTPPGLGHLSPGGPLAWSIAGLIAGFAATRTVAAMRRTLQRRNQAVVPQWAAETRFESASGVEIRVVPIAAPLAFAVAGRDPHIVVSKGMMSHLSQQELSALIAHETAHLRLRHDRHLLVFHLYQHIWGWLPGVQHVNAQLTATVEQWADLEAIASHSTDSTDLSAAVRTIADLGPCRHVGAERSKAIETGMNGSSLSQSLGLVGLVASLLMAASLAISHSVGDLGAAIAAIH